MHVNVHIPPCLAGSREDLCSCRGSAVHRGCRLRVASWPEARTVPSLCGSGSCGASEARAIASRGAAGLYACLELPKLITGGGNRLRCIGLRRAGSRGALALSDRAGTGAAWWLQRGLCNLESGCLAGLAHLPRPRDVDPGVAVDKKSLRQAAEVSVIIRGLDVCEARSTAAN